jgi:hypothetical protein
MTLTILDSQTGAKVTITVPDRLRAPRATPAEVIRPPRFAQAST